MTAPLLGITVVLNEDPTAFFTGPTANSGEVPRKYHVALSGRPYMLDLESGLFRAPASVPNARDSTDDKDTPGEQTLTRDVLWRRTQTTWDAGAGQASWDGADSNPARFATSRGINVWTREQFDLLYDTEQKVGVEGAGEGGFSNLRLVVAGPYLYMTTQHDIQFTDDITPASPEFTPVTGFPTEDVLALASDGEYLYATDGADVYRFAVAAETVGSAWNTLDCTSLWFGKSRLLAGQDNVLYNITSSTPPSALFTHPTAAWEWSAFAEGPTHIYAAGFAGERSTVYKVPLKADGTGLDAPLPAVDLPIGETVSSMVGYLGYLVIGTSRGIRIGQLDTSGNVILGPVITAPGDVLCVFPFDRFVWFGWSQFDETHTGVGRIDLSNFTDTLTPAYASDLMAVDPGDVVSIARLNGKIVFAVDRGDADGVYGETDERVASGYVTSGAMSWGLADEKIVQIVKVAHRPLDGSVSVAVSADRGETYPTVGTVTGGGGEVSTFTVNGQETGAADIKVTIGWSPGDSESSPTVEKVTTFAYPLPDRGEQFILPLLLAEQLVVLNGETVGVDIWGEVDAIRDMTEGGLVSLQIGSKVWTVKVEDFEFAPTHLTVDRRAWNGTLTVKAKSIAEVET